MKARVKLTGEIVNIKDLYDDGTALVNDKYFKVNLISLVKLSTGNSVDTNWQKKSLMWL